LVEHTTSYQFFTIRIWQIHQTKQPKAKKKTQQQQQQQHQQQQHGCYRGAEWRTDDDL